MDTSQERRACWCGPTRGGRPATVVLVMPEGRYRWRIEGNGDDDVTVEGYAATADAAMEAADAIGRSL